MSKFSIRCRACGRRLEEVFCAFCEHCRDSLLVTEYAETRFSEGPGRDIWRFNWLPVRRAARPASGPVVYRSEGLSRRLELPNLYIAFNGYWPEKGAAIETCTFKEYEAAVVMENARENGIEGLVVASAGNTARAFAHLSARTGFPVVIVVPRMCLREMWYLEAPERIPTIVVEDGDYSDAIDVARNVALTAGMPFEGGVKNVAKRDGLGIVLLESVSAMGGLPDHYFQAVGSGAGAIAAWEMAQRFLGDGRFGSRLPRLHLAQNLPFAPMTKAWQRGRRALDPDDLRPELIPLISTRVLSNRYPAYGVRGGVFDALTATDGSMYGVENDEAAEAMALFEETEGIDIVPAAAVALGALIRVAKEGAIPREETILLNITGGGERRLIDAGKPSLVTGTKVSKKISNGEIEELLCTVLKKDCSKP